MLSQFNKTFKPFLSMGFSKSQQPWQKVSRCAVYSSQPYDVEYFTKCNSKIENKKQVYLEFHEEELNEKTAKFTHGFDTVCAFVNDRLDANCLEILRANGVDLIALRCAGFNNVDMAKATELGMTAVRVPAYSPYAVAEHAMALLQTLNRRIHKAYNRTKEGNFSLSGLTGFDLHGKTVGIIGAGKIGQVFGSICRGYQMNINYFDVQESPEMEALGGKRLSLDDLFHTSDVISLHCPLTPQTKYLINKDTVAKMKKGVHIINTGRGALIHTRSVINGLKKHKIGGLCLDVYEQEEDFFFRDTSQEIMNDDDLARLLTFPNVIVTGHQAFFTDEALMNICDTTLHNIIDIKTTGKCTNAVQSPKSS